MLSRQRLFLGFWALAATQMLNAQQAPPFTAQDLVRLTRLSDPQVSPSGRQLVYVLRETDTESNQGRTDLWTLDLTVRNARPVRIAPHEASESSPRWAPDGQFIYFLSTRSGTQQVWRVAPTGGIPTQVTNFPLDVGTLKISPNGNRLALTMEVLPDCTDLLCTRDKLEASHHSKAHGRIYDQLFVRHWDTWANGIRSHLFVAAINVDGTAGAPVDISKSLDADVPSKPFGGDEEFAFSADGKRIVFTARVAGRSEPWSTNFDLFESPADGSAVPHNLTAANLAWDTQPVWLKNGNLAYLAMERPGFEADRFHIMVRNARTGATHEVARSWDRSVARLGVARDGRTLLASADDVGQEPLFAIDSSDGTVRKLVTSGQVTEFAPAKNSVVFAMASLAAPADLFTTSLTGHAPPRQLTAVNQAALSGRAISAFEQFQFKGADEATISGYMVKPYGFKPGERYPVALVVHGGPQAGFGNIWTYRWNAQAFAGRGYGVVMIDFHGTPGYGQAFTNSISTDWGGKPLIDLQKGLTAALARYPWLDGNRVCALGASYGGFMMNWIEGHWPDRFRCLVNHDGLFDQRLMYYSTEELWFPEWEFGRPYYENPQAYEQFNPVNAVKQWRTPMLVIHGEQDFRIPYSQGLGAFTALQRRGIESKLLVFPDENHWVLKPANSVQWYETTLDWLDAHTRQ